MRWTSATTSNSREQADLTFWYRRMSFCEIIWCFHCLFNLEFWHVCYLRLPLGLWSNCWHREVCGSIIHFEFFWRFGWSGWVVARIFIDPINFVIFCIAMVWSLSFVETSHIKGVGCLRWPISIHDLGDWWQSWYFDFMRRLSSNIAMPSSIITSSTYLLTSLDLLLPIFKMLQIYSWLWVSYPIENFQIIFHKSFVRGLSLLTFDFRHVVRRPFKIFRSRYGVIRRWMKHFGQLLIIFDRRLSLERSLSINDCFNFIKQYFIPSFDLHIPFVLDLNCFSIWFLSQVVVLG